ncbi:MAG: hypothetical protein V4717_23320 [Bacteroidota bacterium]
MKIFLRYALCVSLSVFGITENVAQQNVGIGTSTPAYPLTVIANENAKGITQKSASVELGFATSEIDGAYLKTFSPHDLHLTVNNGSPKLSILNYNGYVGVNTNSPTAQLDINGTFRLRNNGAAAGHVLTSDANGNASW